MPDGVRCDQELPKTGRCFSESLPPRDFLRTLAKVGSTGRRAVWDRDMIMVEAATTSKRSFSARNLATRTSTLVSPFCTPPTRLSARVLQPWPRTLKDFMLFSGEDTLLIWVALLRT